MERTEFLALARQHKDMVFRLALNRLGNAHDAEDIVQEALLRLYERGEAFESAGHAKNWLVRVTLNLCKNTLRAPWRRSVPLDELREAAAFDRLEQGELFEQVMALPEKYRTVLYLFYYEGYSALETAALLGLSETAVTTRLSRARQMLKKGLTEGEA